MAKRRSLAPSEDSDESTEGRRSPRNSEERKRIARSKKPKDGPLWKKALVPGGVVAVIAVVALVVIWGTGHLFTAPCLSLSPIPASSGTPAFPTQNTTDFSRTWCPDDTSVLLSYPSIQIEINGGTVALPDSIGRSANFTDYTCNLPIETQAASSGLGTNVVEISSPWAYQYTLSDFFAVWADSYTTAHVNASYSASTIDYTSTELLGLPIDSGHIVTLFVDNQPNSAGPGLDLSTTSYLTSVYPACISTVYGTGHTIVIQYKDASSTAVGRGLQGPVLSTAGAGGALTSLEYGSPLPRVTLTVEDASGLEQSKDASFAWLALRIAP